MKLFDIKKFSIQKGFTLIELLVVIAILGVLAAGLLVAINPLKKINQAKDATMKSSMSQIANALQANFTSSNGIYPATLATLSSSGELKVVPNQPSGSAFNYVVSTVCTTSSCNAAVWGSYSDTSVGTYYCWDSTNLVYKTSATAPTAAAPTCP